MRTIKLMADYDCFPLWEILDDGLENIDPLDLPISEDLHDALQNWTDKYNATLKDDDPISSSFASNEEEEAFKEEGEELFQWLKKELGENFKILKYIDK
jgi:hypothetical protein